MVAKGENDKPKEVAGLLLETEEEVKLFLEAIERKEIKANYKKKVSEMVHDMQSPMEKINQLKLERCKLEFNA
jgi:hypothetical protein